MVSLINRVEGTYARDLDGDGAEELVVFEYENISCWKMISTDPWTWQQRDDLLSSLYFPAGTRAAIFGDFDGDSRLNAIYKIVHADSTGGLAFYEQEPDGEWAGEIADARIPYSLFDGDFDHDGDADAAVVWKNAAGATSTVFYENTRGRTITHESNLSGWMGGDLDGDGEWEGLLLPQEYGRFIMVEVEPHFTEYLEVIQANYLGRFAGPVIGQFKTRDGFVMAGGQNHLLPKYPPDYTYFSPMARTSGGWEPLPNGFSSTSALLSSAQLADLDGDGLQDILHRQLSCQSSTPSDYEWWLWRNIGSAAADSFRFSETTARQLTEFNARPDTVFSNLQIGDINGDGRAELAALVRVRNQPAQIWFYSISGSFSQMSFYYQHLADAGLPRGIIEFALADLDGDGVCEVAARLNGWKIYSGGESTWTISTMELPALGTGVPTFADLDNDGDMDIVTASAVWVNTRFTEADEPFILQPSVFKLSAYPNPFNARANIVFNMEQAYRVKLDIYDLLGRQVTTLLDEMLPPGEHSVSFDGSALSAGIYFARITTPLHQRTLKLVLVK